MSLATSFRQTSNLKDRIIEFVLCRKGTHAWRNYSVLKVIEDLEFHAERGTLLVQEDDKGKISGVLVYTRHPLYIEAEDLVADKLSMIFFIITMMQHYPGLGLKYTHKGKEVLLSKDNVVKLIKKLYGKNSH